MSFKNWFFEILKEKIIIRSWLLLEYCITFCSNMQLSEIYGNSFNIKIYVKYYSHMYTGEKTKIEGNLC